MTNRVFPEEELREMGTATLTLLTEAIEQGDKNKAKSLAKRMSQEFEFMHDLYVDWTAALMDCIYNDQGANALYHALRKAVGTPPRPSNRAQTPDTQSPDSTSAFRNQVSYLASVMRGHLQPMIIEEDDEKVCMTMKPCGSGQRLMECGAYGPPRNLTMIEEPHVITWGMTNFPIYCTHAPVLEMLSIEQVGYPMTVIYPSEEVATESCRYCIYKNPDDIPDEVYERVGKQKPNTQI